MGSDINELKEAWKRAADSDVIRAATEDWEGYSPQAQPIIEAEARNRGLLEEVLALRGKKPGLKPSTEFAEILYIPGKVIDHNIGICGRCGAKIEITKDRFLSRFFGKSFLSRFVGKSENHFCSNCGIFLRMTPLNAIYMGLIEFIFFCFLFIVELTSGKSENISPARSFLCFLILCAIFDGGKRLFCGISGVFKAKKEAAKRNKEAEKILKQQKGKS